MKSIRDHPGEREQMAKLSLNREMIEARLANIRNCLIEMYKLAELSKEEFLSDVRNWAACEIEAFLEINS